MSSLRIAKLYDELVGADQVSGVLKYPSERTSRHEFGVRLVHKESCFVGFFERSVAMMERH